MGGTDGRHGWAARWAGESLGKGGRLTSLLNRPPQMNRHVVDLARARSDLSRSKAEHEEQLQRVVNRYAEEAAC